MISNVSPSTQESACSIWQRLSEDAHHLHLCKVQPEALSRGRLERREAIGLWVPAHQTERAAWVRAGLAEEGDGGGSAGCLPCIPAVVSNPVELLVGEVTVRVELSTAPRKAHTMKVAAARPVRDDSAMTVIKELVVGRGGHTSTAVGPQSAVEW